MYRHRVCVAVSLIKVLDTVIAVAQPTASPLSVPVAHSGTAILHSSSCGSWPSSLYVFDARHRPLQGMYGENRHQWGYFHFDMGQSIGSS